MNEENKIENKIENLSEISKVCELNELITNFSVINDFIKQSIMYISIKKGKKEEISLEEIDIFNDKFTKMKEIIDKIIKY
jgi:hypothetical protein